ncbi:MAG: chloramphenicol acetyltransferase [Saprospiraceae bacterium]
MSGQKISFADDPHRQKHFDFFNQMDQPHFNLTTPLEIGPLLVYLKKHNIGLTPAMVYLVSQTANETPAFRQRIRGNEIYQHDLVHPSFTVKTEASSVFSFCYVDFNASFPIFLKQTEEAIKRMQSAPSFEDDHTRDDYLFISVLPWIPFTSLQHAMHYHPTDSVPRLAWGKYKQVDQKTQMPLSIQAHHALVDGMDMGHFYQNLQERCLNPELILSID